ncbi:MAG: hydantoinase/oxoprolinase, partial [Acetobacteraceae bacterium]|nr:hydantoinase/oxoprolinase [Acetobacteraceae bacterium]
DRLETALDEAIARLGPATTPVVTMTGELADVFESRAHGVAAITAMLEARLGTLLVYAGRSGFVPSSQVSSHVGDIASANWHASAALAARFVPDALLVDMGSTTTDIVPLVSGAVRHAGYSDAERLASGELVYTGLTRSFVMTLGPRAPVSGEWIALAGEYFASTADVYRVLGALPDGADQLPAADGRAKTVPASTARLARMVGRDAADADEASWRALAAWFAEVQLRQIEEGARLVLSRAALDRAAPVIGAGIGRGVIEQLAMRLRRPYRDFGELVCPSPQPSPRARGEGAATPNPSPPRGRGLGEGDCAPAVAVALLALGQSRA